jgi:hydroxyacyl-ACP dehydratase HTD2-like protein with hotdog domain
VTTLDASAIGRTGQPFEVRVERGRLRALAVAAMAQDPVFQQDEHAPAPLTILSAVARLTDYPGADPLQPGDLDLTRVLAAGAEFRYPNGPLLEGERLNAVARISDVYTKQGARGSMTFVEQTTTVTDAAGDVRAEYVARMIEMPLAEPTGDPK